MKYVYIPSPSLDQRIEQLNQISYFIQNAPVTPQLKVNLRLSSTLKSSLFSAKIEGNKLTLDQLNQKISNPKTREKIEINNLMHAINLIGSSRSVKNISISFIKKLHQLSMQNLDSSAGHFRTEVTAIFNQAGVAVYLTPSVKEIIPELQKLIEYIKKSKDSIYVKSAIAHYWFEKIHPFADGNGRVGRLLIRFLIDNLGQNFKGLLSFEEQIEKTRVDYYDLLQQNSKSITDFVEYILECLCESGRKVVEILKNPVIEESPVQLLLPRRQEIVHLLEDHQYLSFDQIRRRFMSVNESTLRNDLKQLILKDFVQKVGTTRGALYQKKQ